MRENVLWQDGWLLLGLGMMLRSFQGQPAQAYGGDFSEGAARWLQS